MQQTTYDIIIIGGGLAGLSAGLHLSQSQVNVLLIEKHKYPRHKVCGEYVSKEILPYLNSLGVDPISEGAVSISDFSISTRDGKEISTELPLGGFGMSRYALDKLMYDKLSETAELVTDQVTTVNFKEDQFEVRTLGGNQYSAKYVVGAFGKRSVLDKFFERPFIKERTHWMAVKAHYNYDFPENKVALHNFEGGYCGLSKTESGTVNACYLTTINSFRRSKGIGDFQETVMSRNAHLAKFFSEAEPLFDNPLTISQISFAKKKAVVDHVFMLGDSAGLIHPLCGNGMAMAIHSAKLFSEALLNHIKEASGDREKLEDAYETLWNNTFAARMRTGSTIQRILLNDTASSLAYRAATLFPSLVPRIIKRTHGEELV